MYYIHHDVDDDVDVDDSLPVHPGPDDGGADEKQENQEKTEHNIYQMKGEVEYADDSNDTSDSGEVSSAVSFDEDDVHDEEDNWDDLPSLIDEVDDARRGETVDEW